MGTQIIFFYCVADDLFKSMHVKEDSQTVMTNAEVVTVSLTASLFFAGNHEKARSFLEEEGYIPHMLSKSRFCRRLHAIPEDFWKRLSFELPGLEEEVNRKEFIVDSFPIPACENIRIPRRHLFREERYRGICISKRQYFLGLKVHVVMTPSYHPIEWIFTPGGENDERAFRRFSLNLPEESTIYADSAYTDYEEEDLLLETQKIHLYAQRKSNSKRQRPGWVEFVTKSMRKKIETGFSMLTSLFPKRIHAVTNRGFMLKCASFITAFCCWQAFLSGQI